MFKKVLTAILFRVFVTTILFLIICFAIAIAVSKGNAVEHIHTKDCNHRISHFAKIDPSKGRYYGEKKEYYVFCRLYDEKIDNNYLKQANSFKKIAPKNNSIIFFLSRYWHEVLPVNCPSKNFADGRFTINGWLHKS